MTALDLTAGEHQHSAAVEEAAGFLAATPPRERPVPLVPALREMFGLSAIEACEAIRLSHGKEKPAG